MVPFESSLPVLASVASALALFLVYEVWVVLAESAAMRRAQLRVDTSLRRGRVVLVGTVMTDTGGPAITLAIRQQGSEHGKPEKRWHEWRETRRELTVRSFRLRLEDGSFVRVGALPTPTLRVSTPMRSAAPCPSSSHATSHSPCRASSRASR